MKKSVFTRIFVLIFSLALLIGSVVCVAASADESDEYGIEAINISHGDKIRVLIAVDAPVEAAENIVVKYTYAGDEYVAKYWKNDAIYGDETLYPIFYTVGIAAKDMGEDITAWVGEDDSDARDVSVVSYLYNRLYREGIITKTEGKDANRKELYLKLLDYGARAQQVLWNNVEGNEPRTLVTDYSYVSVTDGSINDGGSTALVAGDVTVDYTGPSRDDFRGWDITAYIDGEAVTSRSYKSQLKMEAGISFTATPYMNANLFHFEDIAVGTGWVGVGTGEPNADGKYAGASLVPTGTMPSVITLNSTTAIPNPDAVLNIASDTDSDNKYLKIINTGRTLTQTSFGNSIRFFLNTPVADTSACDTTTIEMDMRVNSAVIGNTIFDIAARRTTAFTGDDATTMTKFECRISGSDVNFIYGGQTYKVGTLGTWFKLKLVYNDGKDTMDVYADGDLKFTISTTNSKSAASLVNRLYVNPASGFASNFDIDNYCAVHSNSAE